MTTFATWLAILSLAAFAVWGVFHGSGDFGSVPEYERSGE